ncbi:MAG: type IVB secretion system protein IcmH/DotU [Pseudomonadota bacterium]
MQDDDRPIENLDQTIIRPRPGGSRGRSGSGGASPAPSVGATSPSPIAASLPGNPLLQASAAIFAAVQRLRTMPTHNNPAALREAMIAQMRTFEQGVLSRGVAPQTARAAQYAVCALVDEAVLATPWGAHGGWAQESLVATLHGETTGGERFFEILRGAAETPSTNLDLLELLHACLTLGFKGKFSVAPNGAQHLSDIEAGLYNTIRTQRGPQETELSPQWRGVEAEPPAVARIAPYWVFAAGVGAVLLLIFFGFLIAVEGRSDDVYRRLSALGAKNASGVAETVTPSGLVATDPDALDATALAADLRQLLDAERRAGVIDVRAEGDAVRVVVRNRGRDGGQMFGSGRASVARAYRPLLTKIGAAIPDRARTVFVEGHTDRQPIRTLQFGSNYELSQARAQAVTAILRDAAPRPERLIAKPMADTAPLADPALRDDLAAHRRIEIVISTV